MPSPKRLSVALCLCLGAGCSGRGHVEVNTDRDEVEPDDEDDDAEADADRDDGSDEALGCASVEERAEVHRRPVDIIFVVDNSGSMSEEIRSVEERINGDFAEIIESSGVDYRVLMVSRYGDNSETPIGYPICIDPPLSSHGCDGWPDTKVSNGERFIHFSAIVESLDAWCVLLESFDAADEYDHNREVGFGVFPPREWESSSPHGLRPHLRAAAFKQLVIISDDSMFCYTTAAEAEVGAPALTREGVWNEAVFEHPEFFFGTEPDLTDYLETVGYDVAPFPTDFSARRFDAALTRRAGEHFGTPEARNYRVHSIVNFEGDRALAPDEPLATSCRGLDVPCRPGLSHQQLSMLTGGLRYPISRYDNYDEIFHALAQDTIERAQLSCAWTLPPPPDGEALDPKKVNVKYSPGTGGSRIIPQSSDCASGEGWRYDDDDVPTRIEACPATCDVLRSDEQGAIDISFGCATVLL